MGMLPHRIRDVMCTPSCWRNWRTVNAFAEGQKLANLVADGDQKSW